MLAAFALLAPAGAGRADARAGLRTTEPAGASGDSPRLVVPIDLVGANHALGRAQLPSAGPWRLVVDAMDASGETVRLEATVEVRG